MLTMSTKFLISKLPCYISSCCGGVLHFHRIHVCFFTFLSLIFCNSTNLLQPFDWIKKTFFETPEPTN